MSFLHCRTILVLLLLLVFFLLIIQVRVRQKTQVKKTLRLCFVGFCPCHCRFDLVFLWRKCRGSVASLLFARCFCPWLVYLVRPVVVALSNLAATVDGSVQRLLHQLTIFAFTSLVYPVKVFSRMTKGAFRKLLGLWRRLADGTDRRSIHVHTVFDIGSFLLITCSLLQRRPQVGRRPLVASIFNDNLNVLVSTNLTVMLPRLLG